MVSHVCLWGLGGLVGNGKKTEHTYLLQGVGFRFRVPWVRVQALGSRGYTAI